MVTIILCDDDPFTLQLLSELLERAIRQSKAEANLSVWPLLVRSRSSLSAAVEAISIFSIMTWEGIPPNGVDLVRQIYHTDPGGKIVFVTGHGEKGMDILRSGVRPFGFIENVWIRMRWFGSIFDIWKWRCRSSKTARTGTPSNCPSGSMKRYGCRFLRYCMWIPSKQWPILFAVI